MVAMDVDARPSMLEAPPRELAFTLDSPDSPRFDLLLPFRDASIERLGPLRNYTLGRYGGWVHTPWRSLAWASEVTEPSDDPSIPFAIAPLASLDDIDLDVVSDRSWLKAFDPVRPPLFDWTGTGLETDGFGTVFHLPPVKPVLDWRCRRRPITVIRYGSESDRFELVRCDGTTAPFALDKLSVLARPPDAARPEGGELPEEPDDAAWNARHEWVDGVRVMHPRLIWALQKLADAFPYKAVYIYSGYRPLAQVHDGTSHMSLHAMGRALDITFYGVTKEDLFKACRELKDVGCGYYPHTPFVHVDVRRAATGQAYWIDDSAPGAPAHYVDGWPGVVESGALSWVPASPR